MSERDGGDVGLVGLGLMGSAMADILLETGHGVHGYDPDARARQAHEDRGGTVHESPADVARQCPVVLLSLPDGTVSRSVCLGADGVLEGARPGTVVVDTTTASPEKSIEIGNALAAAGLHYYDAGLSGSSDTVRQRGTLGLVGGPAEHVAAVRGVLDVFCHEVLHVGGLGDGMRTKLVVNNVHGLHRFALAEGLVLAEKMGLDLAQTLSALRASAAYSRAMDNWGPQMVERSYRNPKSRINTYDKDVRLILAQGHAHGAPMLAMAQFQQLLQTAKAIGLGDADNSSVIEVLRLMAGIEPAV